MINKLKETPRPVQYNPLDDTKKVATVTKEVRIRSRGFRLAVIEAYDYACAVCGMKIISPDLTAWEVEAAHIVPHSSKGKDDILNGVALCHLHHWAFDVGWFTLTDMYSIQVSSRLDSLNEEFGKMNGVDVLKATIRQNSKIDLPNRKEIHPHKNSLHWHRINVFEKIENKWKSSLIGTKLFTQ